MNNFLDSLYPFTGAFIVFSLLVFWSICKYIFIEIKDYLTRPIYPSYSQQEIEIICNEAAEFVHRKHRPWDLDDGFSEYLWICDELSKDRNYLKNN